MHIVSQLLCTWQAFLDLAPAFGLGRVWRSRRGIVHVSPAVAHELARVRDVLTLMWSKLNVWQPSTRCTVVAGEGVTAVHDVVGWRRTRSLLLCAADTAPHLWARVDAHALCGPPSHLSRGTLARCRTAAPIHESR